MEKHELQKIYNYENSSLESRNMSEVGMLINFMATHKADLIYIDQTIGHNEEANYDELYEQQEFAQESYDNFRDELKKVMATKDKSALIEYLALTKKDAKEKFETDKTPMYIPQKERDFTPEEYDAYINKRTLKAQYDSICDAERTFAFMERKIDK